MGEALPIENALGATTARMRGKVCLVTGGGSGIVVDVIVNDRTEHAQVWVEKSDRTLSYPPCELIFR